MRYLLICTFLFISDCLAFFPNDKNAYHQFLLKKDVKKSSQSFEAFENNLNYINQHNEKNCSYSLRINNFVDENEKDFLDTYLPQEFPPLQKINTQYSFSNLPYSFSKSINWRDKQKVTPVKNQGNCGSCWAFSAVGAIESKIAIDGKKLQNLSEQMVVDCSSSNYGCSGGFMHTAFQDIIKMGGICSNENYPYQMMKQTCNLNVPKIDGTKISGYDFILPQNIQALKNAVNKQPICVALAADSQDFRFYGGGIFDNDNLSKRMNHAVLLVGYEENCPVPYWIIKNSWGSEWGENGYIRIKINDGKGILGINQYGVYPI